MKTHSRILIVILLAAVLMLPTSIFGVSAAHDISAAALTTGYHLPLYASIIVSEATDVNDLAIFSPNLYIGIGSGTPLYISKNDSAQTFSIAPNNGNQAGLIIPITNQGYGLSVLGTLNTNDVSANGSVIATGALNGATLNTNMVYANMVYASGAVGAGTVNTNTVNTNTVNTDTVNATGALSGTTVNTDTVNTDTVSTNKLVLDGSVVSIQGDKICFSVTGTTTNYCSYNTVTCKKSRTMAVEEEKGYDNKGKCFDGTRDYCNTQCKNMMACNGNTLNNCSTSTVAYFSSGTMSGAWTCSKIGSGSLFYYNRYGSTDTSNPGVCTCNVDTTYHEEIIASQDTSGTYCATGVLQ